MNQKNGRTDPGPLRERARSLFISQATIDETLEWATPRQLAAIDRMLATELANREASKRARLMRQARFPVPKSLDGYDFANVRLPNGYTKEQLTGLDFAAKAQDLVFYGKTGRGKTHLATALGMLAIEQGRSVRFRQTAELVLQLGKAKRDGALDNLLKDLARADLIILDEFGYVPFDIDGARLLYQIIAGSYERRSIILRHEHRVRQMGDDLRRRQTRRRDHRPHRPPRTPHRIHRPQPTRQPGPHVRQDGQPVKQTTGRHSSCRKPKKISDETRNTDLTKYSMVHFERNILARVNPGNRDWTVDVLKAVFSMEPRDKALEKAESVAEEMEARKPKEAEFCLREGIGETTTYLLDDYPREHRRLIRTNNMIERLNREIRRRTRVVGSFPDGRSALMLVCARIRYVTSSEWSTRRYLDMSRLGENLPAAN